MKTVALVGMLVGGMLAMGCAPGLSHHRVQANSVGTTTINLAVVPRAIDVSDPWVAIDTTDPWSDSPSANETSAPPTRREAAPQR